LKRPESKEGKRWLEQAHRDLDDAVYSRKGKRFNLCCFLSQQAAEKAIKAFLYSRGAESVWGHSIAELCDDSQKLDAGFNDLKKECAPLDRFYIPTRYPNGLPGGIPADAYKDEDAHRALTMAEQVISFVKKKIAS
jgi:HEPN domain-containing protein